MIDWDGLVLAPLQAVFADPIVFTPTISQPGVPPFLARGIFAVKQVTVRTEEGEFTDQQPTLGIRFADYAVPPKQGDSFARAGTVWNLYDVQPDGQGGADLVLKQDM